MANFTLLLLRFAGEKSSMMRNFKFLNKLEPVLWLWWHWKGISWTFEWSGIIVTIVNFFYRILLLLKVIEERRRSSRSIISDSFIQLLKLLNNLFKFFYRNVYIANFIFMNLHSIVFYFVFWKTSYEWGNIKNIFK